MVVRNELTRWDGETLKAVSGSLKEALLTKRRSCDGGPIARTQQ